MKNWMIGVDVSTLLEVERCGGRFTDHGVTGDALAILKSYGVNMVRLRLWNDPYSPKGEPYGAGSCDLDYVTTLAKRARTLGLSWLLDLHYSDFWADPGKQTVPKAWQGLTEEELVKVVGSYTAQVLDALREAGVPPQMVSVGNELSYGLLWPMGKTPRYDTITRLVSAGVEAVRAFDPSVPVMLHLDNGGNNALYREWFDSYFANGGADFECIGLSYYPFWHGTMADLGANLRDIGARYGKDLIVAETSMGFTMEDYQRHEKLPPEARKGMATRPALVEKVDYPMTPEGQRRFLRDLIALLRETPHAAGYCWWEPCWLPVPGSQWATPAGCAYVGEPGPGGNEWANQALFDYDGNALPALEELRQDARQEDQHDK